jgi:hypothetical protein
MSKPTGELADGILRLDFDRRVMLQFRGSAVTFAADSGGGVCPQRRQAAQRKGLVDRSKLGHDHA